MKGGVQFLQGEVEGPFRIHLLLPDRIHRVLNEHLVIQDHEVDIEDEGVTAHFGVQNLLFDLCQLFPRLLDGLEKPFHLLLHLIRIDPSSPEDGPWIGRPERLFP